MVNCIMVGCDLHDKSMLLAVTVGQAKPLVRSWGADGPARRAMIRDLLGRARQAQAGRVVFAYEACGFGFGLHDELSAAGIEAYVLAPSRMARSARHRRGKTDERDAQAILDIVRAHVLAGVAMPSVWVPDLGTRDDRELVRRRLNVAEDASAAQTRIRWLLKRYGIESVPSSCTLDYWHQLGRLVETRRPSGASSALGSLMRQTEWLWQETGRLDDEVLALSRTSRYAAVVAALRAHKGVGVLTAMVYLTELGDLGRFANRRQVGSFLGLTPSSHESGEDDDPKGHITRQGPGRVRKVLCQAVWSAIRVVPSERAAYDRLVRKNPQHKKIAVVARMRALAVRLWHAGLQAQRLAPAEPATA